MVFAVITGLIMAFLAMLVSALLSILPSIPVPSWLSGSDSAFGQVFAFGSSMGVWFPTTLALTVLAAYLGIKLVAFTIKVARIVASFMTGGGGSAA
jgi:hypothetical protein